MDGQGREGKGQISVNVAVVTNNEKNVPVTPAIKIAKSQGDNVGTCVLTRRGTIMKDEMMIEKR